ncbi:3-methyladenine DNA glycosylase [Lederbergia citrea]|nr:3-methyladenine DNA glycosylase [Lederbergia citrea]
MAANEKRRDNDSVEQQKKKENGRDIEPQRAPNEKDPRKF